MVGFDQWYRAVNGPCRVYERVVQAAYGPGQYVHQQGFSTCDDILALARATVSGGTSAARLLDLCCGPGGPGQMLGQALGCTVVGLDGSEPAVRQSASSHALGLVGVVGDAVRLPFQAESFDGALMLDSLASIASPAEFTRSAPPTTITTCGLVETLACAGFGLVELRYRTTRAARIAERLVQGMRAERAALSQELGQAAVEDLLSTLDTLARMLSSRRLEEVALVAAKVRR